MEGCELGNPRLIEKDALLVKRKKIRVEIGFRGLCIEFFSSGRALNAVMGGQGVLRPKTNVYVVPHVKRGLRASRG